ncbi:MAG: filamentous hemagglutinin N-terminal domain-containing protein, partial [Betaproteobacteria bacterium]
MRKRFLQAVKSGALMRWVGVVTSLIVVTESFAQVSEVELPTGHQVQSGSVTIDVSDADMTVTQSSDKAIVNWNTFNIGERASVTFNQPSVTSAILNRVLGSDPSYIYGTLRSNGQVFFVNPSGVLFGPNARVDVGGLVASTLSIGDEDFLVGNYQFSGTGGRILNQGSLTGGFIGLVSPDIENAGEISARVG